jgi:hypothetical protein
VAPYLDVGLADLLRDDRSLLAAVAAAFPRRHVRWGDGDASVSVSRTGFGRPIHVRAARERPDDRGLVSFTVDLTDIDVADEKTRTRTYRRVDETLCALAAAARPMVMVAREEFPVDELLDLSAGAAWYLFRSGWVCVERMDERRAAGFRRELAGIEHHESDGVLRWTGASAEAAERLRKVWVRYPRM